VIVVDTDVVSELMKPAAHPLVRDWVRGRRAGLLHTTSITVAEIGYGIRSSALFAGSKIRSCPSMPRRRGTTRPS